MRKVLLLFLFLLALKTASQEVNKLLLTNEVFRAVYGNNADPSDYPAANYPSVYYDLQLNGVYEQKARLLTYLEFNNGISVLRRDLTHFNNNSVPYRTSVIKTLIEAFNVPLKTRGNLPYTDVDKNTLYYEYILTAYDLGMLPVGSIFRPYDSVDYSELTNYINFITNSSRVTIPTQSELKNTCNYFNPGIYTPKTLSQFKGIEQGVFSHYAKNSFVIPDRKMNLNFSHFYSSSMVEIPSAFFPIQPLGRGWSHTYNSYIFQKGNMFFIVWPNGTIDLYNKNERKYISKGVYDDFNERNNYRIDIIKKNQTAYRYKRIDSSKDIYYLVSIEDTNKNEININYESAKEPNTERIKDIVSPSGKKLTFTYLNNSDLINSIEDPIGRKIYFEYSDLWRGYYKTLVGFNDAKYYLTKYQYHISESHRKYLLKRIDLPRGNKIRAKYDDCKNGKLKSYSYNDSPPVTIKTNFDYSSNAPLNSEVSVPTSSGGTQVSNYIFNKNGSLTHFQNNSTRLSIEYPSAGSNVMLPKNTNINGLDVRYRYDDKGNLLEKEIEGSIKETYSYYRDNSLKEYINPRGYRTVFRYNGNGNLNSIQDALGNFITIKNDSYGQVESITNQEGIRVEYGYSKGVVTSIRAPENLTSSFSYDGANRLITKTVNGQTSSYAYDRNDNLKSQTNFAGHTTVFDYDKNDNLTKIVNAKGVATTFTYDDEDQLTSETFGSLTKKYHYKDGVLKSYTKPSGTQVSFSYDGDGRLKQSGSINDIGYNGKGLIKRIANNDIRYDFEYNTYNRLERVVDNFNDAETRYGYDDVGNITQIYYPNNPVGFAVYYSYDAKNRLTKTYARINGTEKLIAEYTYRKDDLLKSINFGNGTQKKYSYDDVGRLTGIFQYDVKIDNSRTTLFSQQIQLNPKGNVEKESYHYTGEKGGYTPIVNEKYAYNNNNHITKAGNHELSVDKDGNTVKKGKINYSYDTDDRLINVQGSNSSSTISASYKYDPYGNRIERKSIDNGSGTKYVWDILNNNIIQEKTSHTSLFYVYGASGLECSIDTQTGKIVNYYHGDIRGSVVFTTKNIRDTKKKITFNKYDDFGKIVNGGSGGLADFKYLGKHGILNEHQDEGLYYIKARYYDATLGRFLTQDPIWSTNLYLYSENNPIHKIDKNGLNSVNIIYYNNDTYTSGIQKTMLMARKKPDSSYGENDINVSFCDVVKALDFFQSGMKGDTELSKDILGEVARDPALSLSQSLVYKYQNQMSEELTRSGNIRFSTQMIYAIQLLGLQGVKMERFLSNIRSIYWYTEITGICK